jgi:hypothetical protein
MTTAQHMQTLISYGGTLVERHVAYTDLVRIAKVNGAQCPEMCADRWMQAYDRTGR